ncbi:hypothetical protein THAOC_16012 [Thalassiosira oceanica]|uniref:Uncharacterized protein n=1 Tax=Thalassiosira oceanica TaxID=159749 RepID=K0SB39_THAOC|nr:hypothetical protein THAOC_16012 [Thalassiosira oceanica]|eukprot:EJK63333.1 hypothetical protein THAOC_16012 [Thalassiosira oceanica]
MGRHGQSLSPTIPRSTYFTRRPFSCKLLSLGGGGTLPTQALMRDPPTVKVHEPQSPLSSSLTGDSGCQKGDNNESVDVPTPNEQYRIAHPESAAKFERTVWFKDVALRAVDCFDTQNASMEPTAKASANIDRR